MTFGSRRTSSGVPSAIFSPWSRTVTRSLMPMTTRMSCSISRTVRPRSRRSLPIRLVSCGRLARVHAGGRLVEQEQRRVRAERAGDLEPALVAVRQVLGELVVAALEADEREAARGPGRGTTASSRRSRGVENSASTQLRLEPAVHPDEHVLEGGHVRGTGGCSGTSGRGRPRPCRWAGRSGRCRAASGAGWYQGGRATPTSSDEERGSTTIAAIADDDRRSRCAETPSRIVMTRERSRGRTHRTGSSQARRGRAIIGVPWNSIAPGGRVVDAGDDVEERRLAGPVRADQADDRALAGS